MALITGLVKALKADDSIFGLPRPPQMHVHIYIERTRCTQFYAPTKVW